MERRNPKSQASINIRSFVKKFIESIPSHEFDSLLNEISYLDHYKSIELKKAIKHHLDEVITRAIKFYRPEVLFRKSFKRSDHILKIDVVDFGYESMYRARNIYPNKRFTLTVYVFAKREEAEEYLVDKLSETIN
jgi:hypothetical protein